MKENIIYVGVDIGYGFVKAISSTGKRVVFPALVGRGREDKITNLFGENKNDINNINVIYNGESYYVGKHAESSDSPSRIFEVERFKHDYTKILLNVAIQLVTEGESDSVKVKVSTGLPLDFYQSQGKEFKNSLVGVQPKIEWKSGVLAGKSIQINIEDSLVFPQGASAIVSALLNHENKHAYPQFMHEGSLMGLIDIGYRTTDFVVIEIGEKSSFIPKLGFSGTIEKGIMNFHKDLKEAFKVSSGGSDLSEANLNRILKNGSIPYKGGQLEFKDTILKSKESIGMSIVDRLKTEWGEESNLFDAIFLAGGGGELLESFIQGSFDNRLIKIPESQFANAIGYLRLGNSLFKR